MTDELRRPWEITTIEEALEAIRLAYEQQTPRTLVQRKRVLVDHGVDNDTEPRRYSGRRKTRIMENNRLAGCKGAVSPNARDFLPVELPLVRSVPYEMATLKVEESKKRMSQSHKSTKQMKADLKRRHIPVPLVRQMEEQVRQFALDGREPAEDGFVIVAPAEKVIYEPSESPATERFIRWLGHSLARLYGLSSESQPPNSIILSLPASHLVSKIPAVPLWLQLNY